MSQAAYEALKKAREELTMHKVHNAIAEGKCSALCGAMVSDSGVVAAVPNEHICPACKKEIEANS